MPAKLEINITINTSLLADPLWGEGFPPGSAPPATPLYFNTGLSLFGRSGSCFLSLDCVLYAGLLIPQSDILKM